MRPHDGPFAMVHCLDCNQSCDLWYESPAEIFVAEAPAPYDPHKHMTLVPLRKKPESPMGFLRKLWSQLTGPTPMTTTKAFCDFCPCRDCQTGDSLHILCHAQTSDGRWICDICYEYDECVSAQRKAGEPVDPCKNKECAHRPKIISEWTRK